MVLLVLILCPIVVIGSFYAAPACPLFLFPANFSGNLATWANLLHQSFFISTQMLSYVLDSEVET